MAMQQKPITTLWTIYKENVCNIHGVTKNANVIVTIFTPFGLPDNKVILSRETFNKLMSNHGVTGAVIKVEELDLPVFKTLSF